MIYNSSPCAIGLYEELLSNYDFDVIAEMFVSEPRGEQALVRTSCCKVTRELQR